MSDDKNNQRHEEPVSRFWACVLPMFLMILGLFWTQKMKKTRKFILILILNGGLFFITRGLFRVEEYWFPTTLENEIIFAAYDGISLGAIVLAIYFMFRWTTEYNLKTFGFKSKKEWKKSQESKNNPSF